MNDESASLAARRANRTSLTVAAGPLAGPVLARTVSMLAARANLPLDRLNDALLITDALAAHAADHVPDGRLTFVIETAPRRIDLRLGPLHAGAGRRLLASAILPEAGNVIERLADEVEIRHARAGGEILAVRVSYAEDS